jgi:hypothetical protein
MILWEGRKMSALWLGLGFWLALNAAVVAIRLYVSTEKNVGRSSARLVHDRRFQ